MPLQRILRRKKLVIDFNCTIFADEFSIVESLKKQVKDLEEKIDQMKNFSSNSTCELESIRKQMKQLEEKHLKDHAALVESYENKMSTLLARLQELEKAHDLVKEQLRESQEKNSILTSVDLKKADAIVALNSEIVMLKDSIKVFSLIIEIYLLELCRTLKKSKSIEDLI